MAVNVRPAAVVLVHGLWMHGVAMEYHRRYLRHAGFDAVSYSYPSVRNSLAANADDLAAFARGLDAPTLHWVGHSLGGIVILCALARATLPPGRVVLAGTPYRGSRAAEILEGQTFGAQLLGRSVREWLAAPKPTDFGGHEVGVIAGSIGVGLGRVVAPGLPQPNDGTIAVEETDVPGACDRIVLPITHTGMLASRTVARQIAAFLRDGRFMHS
ncbi:MAG TPA: alpha/beta hydrolase [Burkholderiales bacterium]|nr:alpha/beta hydrolase [Burkholderiales bacterium]